jgi:hypothetical protein
MGNLRQSMSQEEWDNMGKVINTPKPQPTEWQPKYPSVLGSIDISQKDGKRLMAALAIITTECRTSKTPDECIKEIDDLAYEMYKPTEWQPKWGEEVYVWDSVDTKKEAYYVGANPNPKTKDKYPHVAIFKNNPAGGGGAYQHIRPITKPKTLREEIAELPESLSKETVLAIIYRHEKGATNE